METCALACYTKQQTILAQKHSGTKITSFRPQYAKFLLKNAEIDALMFHTKIYLPQNLCTDLFIHVLSRTYNEESELLLVFFFQVDISKYA